MPKLTDRDEQVELLAARLVEVKTADPDSYSRLSPEEKRGWRATARRVLEELINLPEATR